MPVTRIILMEDYTRLPLNDFLDQVSDRTPTPGGGGVAAAAGALACAMAKMVAAYSMGKKTEDTVRRQVEELATRLHRADELLRASITQDAEAYTHMTEAAKAAKDDPSKQPAYQAAVLSAIAVPMEMGATLSAALSAMDELKTPASRYLLSDLGVAAVIADGAAQAAAYNVRVNLREIADPKVKAKIADDIGAVLTHCTERRASIEAYLARHLEQ
jgi:formiminotetrahydrofolate cyclodeaminase